jgi:TRAP-type C4-dicarboxylate transport system permease small subunit
VRFIDRISDALGLVAAWLFVATGAMLTYEVVARYVFGAPTTWAAEISQLFLIAGVLMALGRTLHRREHISIEVIRPRLGVLGRRIADSFALLFVAAFAGVACYSGFGIAYDSFVKGRSSGTMLNIPNWWSEALIPLGLALLFGQCVTELIRLWRGHPWGNGNRHGASE